MSTRRVALCCGVHRPLPVVLVLLIAVSGCSQRTRPDAEPTQPTREPGIYDVASGERIDKSELLERLKSARFVVFGEQHTSEWQHQRQAALYRPLAASEDRPFALGMEMFQRPFQSALDAYVAGDIDESTMLERTEWKGRWGVDPSLYRPLWKAARSNRLPVVALNVRRELSKKIARVGLDGLDSSERSKLPDRIDTSISAQREYVRRAFEQHDMSEHMEFEHFLEAQAAWDETMAETAVDAVSERDGVERIFIVAGRAHARSDFGIPHRIERRGTGSAGMGVVSILPYSMSELEGSDLSRQIRADYAWIRAAASGQRQLDGYQPRKYARERAPFRRRPSFSQTGARRRTFGFHTRTQPWPALRSKTASRR